MPVSSQGLPHIAGFEPMTLGSAGHYHHITSIKQPSLQVASSISKDPISQVTMKMRKRGERVEVFCMTVLISTQFSNDALIYLWLPLLDIIKNLNAWRPEDMYSYIISRPLSHLMCGRHTMFYSSSPLLDIYIHTIGFFFELD